MAAVRVEFSLLDTNESSFINVGAMDSEIVSSSIRVLYACLSGTNIFDSFIICFAFLSHDTSSSSSSTILRTSAALSRNKSTLARPALENIYVQQGVDVIVQTHYALCIG